MKMKSVLLTLVLTLLVSLFAVGCGETKIEEIPAEEEYSYVNPDETKAETDAGFKIDGVLDEAFYKNNNWLYLANKTGGTDVEIAMTSYFGEKGMYFAYDVTEGNPIYVNLDRPSYLNSGIELHLAPSTVSNMKGNSVFEINLLPSGDMTFKKSNGRGNFINVATTNDIMAVLGATTKGGELNTADCYGYCMELFIPWGYMEKFDLDIDSMKEGYVYSGLAHITSFNEMGTNMSVDRYWYSFDAQNGASWSNVYQYFRFDKDGAQGTVPVTLQAGEHYKIEGAPAVIPGMPMNVTVTPEAGYVLTSIQINGEECIGKVAFNDDGSVTINDRGVAGGVVISAAAEAITEGNKTLTGKVVAHKLGGGNLKNAIASYKGPNGEKLLELDANGKFKLENLKPGNYTIIIEQAGYKKLTRTIYVNRDMDLELSLEYDLFSATGDAWVLDDQNDGVLYKFGGAGELLTNDKYGKFTISAYFKFDKELASEGNATVFTEQRQGLKVAFSNEKIWHIDLLKQGGKYIVQYAKHSGEYSLTGWKTIHELSSAEIAKYTSNQGIELSVQRDGKYANVYLGGTLIGVEVLDSAYAGYTAQVGFESWAANREIKTVSFKISSSTSVNLRNTLFRVTDGWDVSRQYSGLVVKTGSGVKRLTFINKYVDMDLTVTARDYQNSTDKEGVYPRTDILFEFNNGKMMSFGVTTNGKTAYIQSIYDSASADKYINTGWKSWGNLTDEEFAQFQGDGVKFRVARYGTEVSLYIGERLVASADLTANNSGVTATTPATVNIRHFDDAGVRVEIPFQISQKFDLVQVTTGENLTAEKNQYFVGDIVRVIAKDSNNYVSSLKVNGEEVSVNWDGTYSFVATDKEYAITGEVAKTIFKPDAQWNILQQNAGIISIPVRTGDYSSLYTAANTYRDAAVTVRDHTAGVFQMQIRFLFASGKEYQLRLDNDAGFYRIQQMGGSACINGNKWAELCKLTDAQIAKLKSETGIQFRAALVGTYVKVYLDGAEVSSADLSGYGLTADTTAQIRFLMYGNKNVENIVIPYTLGGEPAAATVQIASGITNGTITAGKTSFVAGETITITATPAAGYYLKSLRVNGNAVDLPLSGGTYSITAAEGTYQVEGIFGMKVFEEDSQWDLSLQDEGIVSIPARTGDYASLYTVSKNYTDASVTVTDHESGVFQMQIRFIFAGGKQYQLRLDNDAGFYRIQQMGGSACINGNKWADLHKLTDAQIAKLKSETGIQFRAALVGTYVKVYLGDAEVSSVDISGYGLAADATAQIRFLMYGNKNAENIKVPFKLVEGQLDYATVTIPVLTGGTVSADRKAYLAGETVTLTVIPAEGYRNKSITVKNGDKNVTLSGTFDIDGGSYSFVAEEGVSAYTVSAEFAAPIFGSSDTKNTWDLNGQYNGTITLLNKGNDDAFVRTESNTYREAAVTVRDVVQNGKFEMQVRFFFTNGTKYQVRVYYNTSASQYEMQTMDGIINWLWIKNLSAEQTEKLKNEGVEFRVKLVGTKVELYLDDVLMAHSNPARHDLSSAINAATTAQVQFHMVGNSGAENLKLQFEVVEAEPEPIPVTIPTLANGTVTADKSAYLPGETVTLTVNPAEGYRNKSITVKNGDKDVALNGNFNVDGGSYTFVAEAGVEAYTVSAEFAAPIFGSSDTKNTWDLNGQYNGTITLLSKGNDDAFVKTAANTYREAAVTVRDVVQNGKFEMQVRFFFTNGTKYQVRVYYNTSASQYEMQTMDGIINWLWIKNLSAEQTEKLKNEGVEFRVKLVGTKVELYLDDVLMAHSNPARHDLSSAINAATTAQVQFHMVGNSGAENLKLQYALAEGQSDLVTVTIPTLSNGTVTADKDVYLPGETVTLTVNPAEGYRNKSIAVKNGDTDVALNGTFDIDGGSYTFVAQEGVSTYTVSAEFAAPIFGSADTENSWDLNNQYNGSVTLLQKGDSGAFVKTEANTYREAAVTVRDAAQTGTFEMQLRFFFTNGTKYQVRVYYKADAGQYEMQTMDGIVNWKWIKNLSTAQVTKLKNEGVEFRAKIVGTKVELYLDGVLMAHSDATRHDLSSGIDATTTAQVQFYMVGNSGAKDQVLNFELG